MRRTTHPVRAALAVIATLAAIVSVVVSVDGRVGYVNVPADELAAVGLESMANAVTILEDHEAAAALPATALGPTSPSARSTGWPPDPPGRARTPTGRGSRARNSSGPTTTGP